MIIRSQNARGIVNINNIDSITVKEYSHDICAFNVTMESEILLGKYSTEEKAIKVLDMIQEAYSRMEDIKCGAVQAQKYDSFCFQMPADEYVEV